MSTPHTDNTTYPSIEPPYETMRPGELRACQLAVCRLAHDRDDAATLLQMLGLIPPPPPSNPSNRKGLGPRP
jgi:hypothetical protein